MGWRTLIDIHEETKQVTKVVDGAHVKVDKVWQFYEYSNYKYQTFAEVLQTVEAYSRGLIKVGLKPNQVDKLHIYAQTSHKWMQSYLAASFQNIPIVTAYDTLGESGLIHSLVQTGSNAIFTDNGLLSSLINPLKKAENVKIVIYFDTVDPQDKRMNGTYYSNAQKAIDDIKKIRPDISFYSYDELIELGKANPDIPLQTSKPEDLSCIMYTSGSTGEPKGVVLTNANVVASVGGVSCVAGRNVVKKGDRVIAFLPLAHIFEMAFELMSFWWGSCLGYATVKTLTDALIKNCKSDMVEFKPTVMVGVAAVWEAVRKGVLAKVKDLPTLTQKIFHSCVAAKLSMWKYHIPGSGIFDPIFKKVKAATGGEIRILLNGGSPISHDAQEFISLLIAPMLLGYGLTETAANATVVELSHFEYDVAGTLTGAITAKLVDVADAGYYAKNNQGEVWLKGKCIASHYYKNEKETSEAYEDGWFKTGDIGEWTANGALKIIDRKKNLVKTLNGEYIALEKLESIYRSNPNVLNLMVYADQTKVKPIAVVLPNEKHMKTYLAEEKVFSLEELDNKDMAHLVDDPNVVKAFNKSLLATGKAQGLKGIELLQNVVLLDEEWTPQNGFVTSAQKLQRKKILESCKDKVQKAYGS